MSGEEEKLVLIERRATRQLFKGNRTCLKCGTLLHSKRCLSPISLTMPSDDNSASDTEYDRDVDTGPPQDDDDLQEGSAPPEPYEPRFSNFPHVAH